MSFTDTAPAVFLFVALVACVAALSWYFLRQVRATSSRRFSAAEDETTGREESTLVVPFVVGGARLCPPNANSSPKVHRAPRSKADRLGRRNDFPENETTLGRLLELHKALWLPIAFACMVFTGNFSARAALMTGLFGAYGVAWVVKSNVFPDLQFYNSDKARIRSPLDYVAKFLLIGVYFLYPAVATGMLSGGSGVTNGTSSSDHLHLRWWETTTGAFLFVIGAFFHYAADAQKYFQLRHAPGRLITDGFFGIVRHPSYLGEVLIWLGMTVVAGAGNPYSWVPLVWLLVITVILGIPEKEKSLQRHGVEFAKWKQSVPALVPLAWDF